MTFEFPDKPLLPPFQLRPNKFVDRMLFLELILRTIGQRGAQNYSYISMGATFLHDHHAVYRRVGIDSLISFDMDGEAVKRQLFNRPIDTMKCLKLNSAELPATLDELRGGKNVVVWLDFMYPDQRRSQLQEATNVIRRLVPGDLLRVTLNADFKDFGTFEKADKKHFKNIHAKAAALLREQIEEYLPANFKTLQPYELPSVLSRAVGVAASRGVQHKKNVKIVPVLSTTYADKARMITVACIVRALSEKKLPDSLSGWKFRSTNWDDLKMIHVPDLSIREKQFIDRMITDAPSKIFQSLPFRPKDKKAAKDLKLAIKSYKMLHRYYPAFHHIEY